MKIIASQKQGEVKIILLKDRVIPKDLSKDEKKELEFYGFEGEGSCLVGQSKKFFIGLEKYDYEFPNALSDAIANAICSLKKMKIKSISIEVEKEEEIKKICLGILLGAYSYEEFKSKKNEITLKEVYLNSNKLDEKILQERILESEILATSINHTRDLVNTPPQQATPEYMAKYAENLAKSIGFECQIYDEEFLKKEKMEAFLAVARASVHKPYLVHLSYKPKDIKGQKLPKFVFVGKGLTYDSGGLSLKPGDYMTTMKADKSGACAVIGILEAVAKFGIKAEVHGILGLAENMIGGNAYKPDDILRARNQKTIEVRNTDAEGRLVLADCLSFASDLKPDFLIDLATLTGACVVGLGDYTSGIMGYNKKLQEEFAKVAFRVGELTGILPFNPYLRKLLKSEVADLCNIPSSRYGSAITAGMFLGEFVEESLKDKWLHLDIAGPAYVEKAWGVNPFGASGIGVRACVEFIKSKVK